MVDSGVYVIRFGAGCYVGSAARGFAQRWRVHKHHLLSGTHHNKRLQAICNKHGFDALVFERLLICAPEHVVLYEQIAIDALAPAFNAAPVAGSTLGYRHTKETKLKFAQRKRASTTEAGKEARREGVKRWKMTDAHKAALLAANTGRVVSAETKSKISAAGKGRVFGPMSQEHKAKIGQANKRRAAERAALKASG